MKMPSFCRSDTLDTPSRRHNKKNPYLMPRELRLGGGGLRRGRELKGSSVFINSDCAP